MSGLQCEICNVWVGVCKCPPLSYSNSGKDDPAPAPVPVVDEVFHVDVTSAISTIQQYRVLNSKPLELLKFYREGSPVEVDPKALEKFRFLGLNNTDFIRWWFMNEQFFSTMTVKK